MLIYKQTTKATMKDIEAKLKYHRIDIPKVQLEGRKKILKDNPKFKIEGYQIKCESIKCKSSGRYIFGDLITIWLSGDYQMKMFAPNPC